jgi:precorrin-6A/cobalt-precorrin-6A reductase
LVRSIELPLTVPENMTVVLARGPFTVGDEIALLEDRRIELMVTRNSGARATEAKLEASRQLGIPVVMVRRPAATSGEQVTTVREALDRIDALLSRA